MIRESGTSDINTAHPKSTSDRTYACTRFIELLFERYGSLENIPMRGRGKAGAELEEEWGSKKLSEMYGLSQNTVTKLYQVVDLNSQIENYPSGTRVQLIAHPNFELPWFLKNISGALGVVSGSDPKEGVLVRFDKHGLEYVHPRFLEKSDAPLPAPPVPTSTPREETSKFQRPQSSGGRTIINPPISASGETEEGQTVTFSAVAKKARVFSDTSRNEDETVQQEQTLAPVPPLEETFQEGCQVRIKNPDSYFYDRAGTITSFPNNGIAIVDFGDGDSEASKEQSADRDCFPLSDLVLVSVPLSDLVLVSAKTLDTEEYQRTPSIDLKSAVQTIVENLERLSFEDIKSLEQALESLKVSQLKAS